MKADLTRNSFHPFKHYIRVLMQQGRVQLDADWNEQAAILLHYLEALAADLIGPHGGPSMQPGFTNPGFTISPYPTAKSPITSDFKIELGRYYVDGMLCEADSTPINVFFPKPKDSPNLLQVDTWSLDGAEFQDNQYVEVFDDAENPKFSPPTVVQITNPDKANRQLTIQGLPTNAKFINATNPKLRRAITYLTQPDYPVPSSDHLSADSRYQVYLDVWERHITYVEDDGIREVALGGPDTATRTKLVWQVKVKKVDDASKCMTVPALNNLFQPENRGRLKAMARQISPSTDPCIISPDARYTGPENQLYRVEIHTGSYDTLGRKTTSTFKWSRENGSVVFPIVSIASGEGTTSVTLENLGRDDRFSLTQWDWVEIQDDWSVLQNRPGNLLQVQSIDQTTLKVTLSGSDSGVEKDLEKYPALHPLLRRWDQKEGDPSEGGLTLETDGAALIKEGSWLTLEDGIQIQFQPPLDPAKPNQYRTGDFWLIPARTATGDVEWPKVIDPKGNPETDPQGNPIPIALPPEGITHHYAPLAVIDGGKITLDCSIRLHRVVP